LSLWSILWSKFLAGVVPLVAAGVALVWASNRFLNVDPFVSWLSNLTVFLMAVTLTGMAVGFGSLFPKFFVENVAQIQTSPGGLLFMVTALFYVALTLSLEAVIMRMHYFAKLARSTAPWSSDGIVYVAAALALLNLIAFLVPFVTGKKNLETADI
jgi:hypothetical protein